SMTQVTERSSKDKTSSSGARLRAQNGGVKRRQTSRIPSRAAPTHLRSGIHELGLKGKTRPVPSSRSTKNEPVQKPKRRPAPAVIFGGAFLLFAGSAFALRSWGDEDDPQKATATEQAPAATDASSAAPAAPAVKPAKKEEPQDGIVAEVPLFGPQAMAVKPAEVPAEKVDVAEAEKRSAAA